MPYIADENADEDPELKAAVMDNSKSAQQLRELFLSQGKQVHLRPSSPLDYSKMI